MTNLAQEGNRFAPSKDLLDQFSLLLADQISGMAGCPPVDGRVPFIILLGNMRGNLQAPQRRDDFVLVIPLVCSNGLWVYTLSLHLLEHLDRCLSLGSARSYREACLHDQPMTVVHQGMPHVSELGFLAQSFTVETGLWIRCGFMCMFDGFSP